MGILQAIALGIVQGLTEFLPVSSSGHLVLAQELIAPDLTQALAFDVALHFGTLAAVLVYFRSDLQAMAAALFPGSQPDRDVRRRWIGLLALATAPVVVVGGLFADSIEQAFHSPTLVGGALLVTASLLWIARKAQGHRGAQALGPRDALVVGLIQCAALVPGISRSGSTICGALLVGIERETAARFAFLMAVPAIAGAVVKNGSALMDLAGSDPVPLALGTLASALTGWLAIEIMMRVVRGGRLAGFSVYCAFIGGLTLWMRLGSSG